jgi:hypothetical protein
MKTTHTQDTALAIMHFLYQFKGDNKFYKLDNSLLNISSKKEKYLSIYTLRDNALIATDSEVYHSHAEEGMTNYVYADEIRAKILPKGVVAVEAMLQQGEPV